VTGSALREWHLELPSTQDRAIALAREGAPAGTRVVAARQTRGRGRLDRTWASPEGGLYLSLLLPSVNAPESLLPLALGAHLATELERSYGVPLSLKWPNDLLSVAGDGPPRKVAGILIDRVVGPDGRAVPVAGIGVNVRPFVPPLPPELAGRVVALGELVTPGPTLEEVEERVVRASDSAIRSLEDEGGRRATRALCRDRLYGVGRPARIDGVLTGTIEALGADGELLLNTGTHRVAIRAGDLRVEETP
jgi:BirA family transcriptional regulator, biotin operon repressor / biotin---[acetyl-CoA-carboxylase] ligase